MTTAPASSPVAGQAERQKQAKLRQSQRYQAVRKSAARRKQTSDQYSPESGPPSDPPVEPTDPTTADGGPADHAQPPEPRWLSHDEQCVWRFYLHATRLLDDHLDRQLQRDAAMPHIYYGMLVQLADAPRRRLRMTELAMRVKITRSRLSHAVARLEKNGWVRREDCVSDKRGQFAVLTEEGYRVLDQAAPGHVEAVRQALFDRLSPEQQKSLGEIMHLIAEGLEPAGAGADLPWLR